MKKIIVVTGASSGFGRMGTQGLAKAGHMVFGPSESFTVKQLLDLYDVNVLGTQRVNRAALPQPRKQGNGLLVWVSSSSARGGTPPYRIGLEDLLVPACETLSRTPYSATFKKGVFL